VQKKITLNKSNLLKIVTCAAANKIKVIPWTTQGFDKTLYFENEWFLGNYFNEIKPSNSLIGYYISADQQIKIDIKPFLDENLLTFTAVISENEENIPEYITFFYRSGNQIKKEKYPFFLAPEEITIQSSKSDNTLIIFSQGESKPFYKESIKLLEDAGYNLYASEIIKESTLAKKSMENLYARIDKYLDEIEVIVFAGSINRSLQAKIESETEKTVIDREELVISIFEKRANGASGKLKVASSIIAKEKSLFKNQVRGLSRIKGGIGLKGPGETKDEERKRVLKNKEKSVKKSLSSESTRLEFQRKFRKKSNFPTVFFIFTYHRRES